MKANLGVRTRPHILVLESVWSSDISDNTSVGPFFEGWARLSGVRVSFRSYYDANSLKTWLKAFASSRTNPYICYIAGHGIKNRLHGATGPDINLRKVLSDIFPKKSGPKAKVGSKGILLGACQVGSADSLESIIKKTDIPLDWIAGYGESVPWMESTLADMLFLKYLIEGRITPETRTEDKPVIQKSESPCKILEWVTTDYPLIADYKPNVATRSR